ncbi:MAG: hypothetical protein Q9187_007986 [Circinaria calcarea]
MSTSPLNLIRNFTQTLHTTPAPSTDPSKVILPSPYVVCIIGASRGIGEETAYAYARAGASGLIISARSTSQLEGVAEKIASISQSIKVRIVACDTTSDPSVHTLATEVRQEFGRLDVLISNAGFAGPLTLRMAEGNPADFQRAFDVNCTGVYLAAHHFIPLLLSSPNGARAFIAVSSIAALMTSGPVANHGYCASKLAQARLVEFMAEQYRDEGLFAVALHPGGVKTGFAAVVPEGFEKYLTDEPGLCGAFCVWLTKNTAEKRWLSGRFLSAKWDVEELTGRKEEVVEKDMLKMRMAVS